MAVTEIPLPRAGRSVSTSDLLTTVYISVSFCIILVYFSRDACQFLLSILYDHSSQLSLLTDHAVAQILQTSVVLEHKLQLEGCRK